jgi:hypothetical protein
MRCNSYSDKTPSVGPRAMNEPAIMTELHISRIVDSSRYRKFLRASVHLLATLPCICAQGQAVPSSSSTNISLTSTEGVDILSGKAGIVDYKGRRAIHLNPVPNAGDDDSTLAIFPTPDFHDASLRSMWRVRRAPVLQKAVRAR